MLLATPPAGEAAAAAHGGDRAEPPQKGVGMCPPSVGVTPKARSSHQMRGVMCLPHPNGTGEMMNPPKRGVEEVCPPNGG